jgi:hypothetical protein
MPQHAQNLRPYRLQLGSILILVLQICASGALFCGFLKLVDDARLSRKTAFFPVKIGQEGARCRRLTAHVKGLRVAR